MDESFDELYRQIESCDKENATLRGHVKKLEKRLADEERSCSQVMKERDEAEEWADNLAAAIAAHCQIDIGEHSNCNNPWQNTPGSIHPTIINTPRAGRKDDLDMYSIHLFAGAGGGILADRLLGHTPICAVEIEDYPRRVLLQRQLDGVLPVFPIWDDVKSFRSDNPECAGFFARAKEVQRELVICGGFP
jgi:hypothetical protein